MITSPPFLRLEQIKLSYIFLDTNVFIDAYENPDQFHELFTSLKNNENVLFTINSVAIEFLRGCRSIQEFDKKKKFMISIINSDIYTITKDSEDYALELALSYQSSGSKIAITDFYLAALLRKFKSSEKTFVISRDHKAFPTNIYDRFNCFVIENEDNVQVFGLYKFNENKYQEILDRVLQ